MMARGCMLCSNFFARRPICGITLQIAFGVCAIIFMVQGIADRRFFRVSRVAANHELITESCDVLFGIDKNVIIFSPSPQVNRVFTFNTIVNILNSDINRLSMYDGFWAKWQHHIFFMFCRNPLTPHIRKIPIGRNGSAEYLTIYVITHILGGSRAKVSPCWSNSPKNNVFCFWIYNNTLKKINKNICPLSKKQIVFSNVRSCFSSFSGHLGIFQAFSYQSQLPYEQRNLSDRSNEQKQSESREPASISSQIFRFIGEPLSLIGEPFVDRRFLVFLPSLSLLLFGLLFGVLAGKYFCRERHLVGAALIGCGWLCGLIDWQLAMAS